MLLDVTITSVLCLCLCPVFVGVTISYVLFVSLYVCCSMGFMPDKYIHTYIHTSVTVFYL